MVADPVKSDLCHVSCHKQGCFCHARFNVTCQLTSTDAMQCGTAAVQFSAALHLRRLASSVIYESLEDVLQLAAAALLWPMTDKTTTEH